jgi:glycine hydroxymethyltransferase
VLIDLRNKGITGKELEVRLDDVGITVNKNSVPFDTESPAITSGIRVGTPAVTTRGFKEDDMKEIAKLIDMTIKVYDTQKEEIKNRVDNICKKYPLY